jgi:rfaE bifunctional protein kinase chain/domain
MKSTLNISRPRFDRIASKFAKRRILVFGDVGVDRYTVGRVSRISPEAPIPIVEVTQTQLKLGLAANVADNIVALGGAPLLVGLVGRDRGAQDFSQLLKRRRITDRFLIHDRSRQTTIKERVVAETQQVCRIDHETNRKIGARVIRGVWERLERALSESDCVIIEDYAKGLVDVSLCRQLIQAAEVRGVPVLVDPNKSSPPSLYQGCTVITPNSAEAEALSGVAITDMESLRHAGKHLLDEVGAKVVIITRGRDGIAIFQQGARDPILIPTFAREVFDVSGAGDTVIATLALSLVAGANIAEASLIANFAAGVEVGKRGTATVTVGELRDYIDLVGSRRAR